jgi:hypothetical protein
LSQLAANARVASSSVTIAPIYTMSIITLTQDCLDDGKTSPIDLKIP